MTQVDAGQWLTIREASKYTGKSLNSLRMMIRRKKLTQVKKVRGERGEEWVIHREAIHDIGHPGQTEKPATYVKDQAEQRPTSDTGQVIALPAEIYLQQQQERDQAVQGLMMYRYKYEELDRKMRLLPAPPEYIAEDIKKRNEITEQARQELAQAKQVIQEKEATLVDKDKVIKAEVEHRQKLGELMHSQEGRLKELNEENEYLIAKIAQARRPWWKKLLKLK